mmetsp:Transcript_21865/g.85688  ORF Transcript_21865/g.85688 Transcript_21865/m.85688 type:complete len:262 (-) Transcript_21865:1428-2213(-)
MWNCTASLLKSTSSASGTAAGTHACHSCFRSARPGVGKATMWRMPVNTALSIPSSVLVQRTTTPPLANWRTWCISKPMSIAVGPDVARASKRRPKSLMQRTAPPFFASLNSMPSEFSRYEWRESSVAALTTSSGLPSSNPRASAAIALPVPAAPCRRQIAPVASRPSKPQSCCNTLLQRISATTVLSCARVAAGRTIESSGVEGTTRRSNFSDINAMQPSICSRAPATRSSMRTTNSLPSLVMAREMAPRMAFLMKPPVSS